MIADDQLVARQAMRRMLEAHDDLEVVAEAGDGVAALEGARWSQPDVLLVDVRMPRLDGIEVTRLLSGSGTTRHIRVVVVTTFDLDEYVFSALRHGASGFILKRSGPTLLVEAIRAAMAGDALISPTITVRLLKHLASTPPSRPAPLEPLTPREIEIAAQVADGKTNADIASELFIAPGTVKTHVASVQRKLGVRNRVGVAVTAWQLGYTSHPPSTG